jgi:hypothetical protein
VLLEDGQQVPGSLLRAVACGGHTPGHLAFLDERDGTLNEGRYSVKTARETSREKLAKVDIE